MSLLQKLIDQRATTWESAKAHLDTVEAEGREFTGEADETWNRYNTDIKELDTRIKELSDLETRNREADEARAKFGGGLKNEERGGGDEMTDRDLARKWAAGEFRSIEFNAAEQRDLTVGTATAGGNTVGTTFVSELYDFMVENSAIRQTNARVIRTTSGEDMVFPKVTGHSSASIIAEAAAIGESDPTFGQLTLGAYKYGYSLQLSSELIEDTSVNLLGFLAEDAGRAIGNGTGAHYVTGTGTGQPNGVLTASTAGVTGATGQSGVPTSDELIDLYHSVIPGYRRDAYWVFSDATAAEIRKLKDADGRYHWVDGLQASQPATILGRPVVIDPNVPDAALSAKSVLFGNFSAYLIRDVSGIRFDRSDDYAFTNDLVTYRVLFRTDADLRDTTGAVKHYVGGAS